MRSGDARRRRVGDQAVEGRPIMQEHSCAAPSRPAIRGQRRAYRQTPRESQENAPPRARAHGRTRSLAWPAARAHLNRMRRLLAAVFLLPTLLAAPAAMAQPGGYGGPPPPYYYGSPPPYYDPPPAYYGGPPTATACFAGPYVCPLNRPAYPGQPCSCPTESGKAAWGYAGSS